MGKKQNLSLKNKRFCFGYSENKWYFLFLQTEMSELIRLAPAHFACFLSGKSFRRTHRMTELN